VEVPFPPPFPTSAKQQAKIIKDNFQQAPSPKNKPQLLKQFPQAESNI